MFFFHFLAECLIRSFRYDQFLIDERQQSCRMLFDEIQNGLIVDVRHRIKFYLFFTINGLFQFEGVRIEKLLQLLVREVDAQLLELVLYNHTAHNTAHSTQHTATTTAEQRA